MVLRRELFHDGALRESHIVLISRNNLVRMLLRGLLDELEQGRFHLLAVDDERAAENLVAAMLGIDLREAEHFRIGQFAAQLPFHLVQILDFFGRKSQPLLLVVLFQIIYIYNRCGFDVHREDALVKPFVHALQHRVVVGCFVRHREIFLNTGNTRQPHVLRDFHGVRAPRRDHLAARPHEKALQFGLCFRRGTAVQPTQLFDFSPVEPVVGFGGDDTPAGSLKKQNRHHIIDM